MAKYVFDSNIFINLQRRQPIDIYPSLWSRIGELMDEGTIVSSQEVYDEIMIGGDDLEKWAKSRKECFVPLFVVIFFIPIQLDGNTAHNGDSLFPADFSPRPLRECLVANSSLGDHCFLDRGSDTMLTVKSFIPLAR